MNEEQFLELTTKNAKTYFEQYLSTLEQDIELGNLQREAVKIARELILNNEIDLSLAKIQELYKLGYIKNYEAKAEYLNEQNNKAISLEINNNNLLSFNFDNYNVILDGELYIWQGMEDIFPTITNIYSFFWYFGFDFVIYVHAYRTDLKSNKKILEDIRDEMEDEENELVDFIAELKDRTKEITMLECTCNKNYKDFEVLDLYTI
ncbi:hypothetical protein [Mycoplasma sp. Z473B]|uniref:hypothetical protein n=1 Tax=Mycoplasma sp. Z473B TaxID=3401667 RepID=UPI003AB07EA7